MSTPIIDKAINKILDAYKPVVEPDFYGILRDGDETVVVGYGHDPVRPVTGILARYSGDAAGMVAAIGAIARREF